MHRSGVARFLGVLLAAGALVLAGQGTALAHAERKSQFPSGTGKVPTYRPFDEARPRVVVCKKDQSPALIEQIADPALKAFNAKLLAECKFEHIQAGVDAVTAQGTNLYVLPGVYREEPSYAPDCTKGYTGGIVPYEQVYSCGAVVNLITVAGQTPDPSKTTPSCDNARCNLQIEGTGARMEDVVVRGGFDSNGDWIKHNGIKADRADGFYLRNMTFELFRENAIYVHETDGYVLDRVNARNNDLYGILSFTSDHGLIKDCKASYNGDSGVYPGGQADVNQDNPNTGPLTRWAVEVTGCESYNNALGLSGTAGNSVYFHDNNFHDNGAGYVTDSFVGNHPGMPQDHAWITNNRIYSNNRNYYKEFVQAGKCDAAIKPADRGYENGTVCPAFPVPVGTGVLIAGGNRNFVNNNLIYDNWRTGVTLFWVPGAIRGDYAPNQQYDTSNGNQFTANRLGLHPAGVAQPNGTDFFWDEQGVGNCWSGNTSVRGAATSDVLTGLPSCPAGSISPVGNLAKTARNAPCAEYNRDSNRNPVGCDWFTTPPVPAGRQPAPGEAVSAAGRPDGTGPTTAGPNAGGTPAAPGPASGVLGRTLAATGGLAVFPLAGGLLVAAGILLVRQRRRGTA